MIEPNTIHLGDCLDIMKDIEEKSIDMILCDLPYGTTVCRWDTVIPFKDLWEQYRRIIKDNGAIVLTAMQPFASFLVNSNLEMFRYEWIWQKTYTTGYMRASYRPLADHENVLVFYKKQPTYNPQGIMVSNKKVNQKLTSLNTSVYAKNNFKGTEVYVQKFKNYPRTVQKIGLPRNAGGVKSLHPTQKPVALFEYLIKTYTNNNELVLDNCAGSFTTAIACMNTNRNYICIEEDEAYFKVGKERIRNHVIQAEM